MKQYYYLICLLYDVNNHADLEGCYPPLPLASVDDIFLYLHNFSHHTQSHS